MQYEDLSPIERIRALPAAERAKVWTDAEKLRRRWDWRGTWARPKQLAPVINPKTGDGDWSTWMLRAGRGYGKTRVGSGWVHERAMAKPGRWIALIGRTPADVRDYMIIGPGGLLRNTAPHERPNYVPSNRALTWPNGSRATIYSDEVPDQLRGFSGDTAWLDEMAKYRNPQDTWDNLSFGMRELTSPGDQPRVLITTTPRPLKVLKEIEALRSTVVVTGSSYENRANLDPTWFANHLSRYEGTRFGRQEISAEIVDDMPGALWTRDVIEKSRIHIDAQGRYPLPEFKRVVVGVDPSGQSDEGGDNVSSVGIVLVGLGADGVAYVLADNTVAGEGPGNWARRVISTAHDTQINGEPVEADLIVAEKNFGGAMVEFTIRSAERSAPVKMVTASRGKVVRAEPVAVLYAKGMVKHVGAFPELEDQMCAFMPDGYAEKGSPDRCDALVWAITELLLQLWRRERFETALPRSG